MNNPGTDTLIPLNARFHVPQTTSTMDEARSLSEKHPSGFVRTDFQSAGRGRLPERSWQVEPEAGFMGTFWFPAPTFGTAPLPHLAGLAVVRACSSLVHGAGLKFYPALQLKWPNDVLCGKRKLAGILCEVSGGTVYAGIGINCSQSSFSGNFRMEPTSILMETGFVARPEMLATRLISAFNDLALCPEIWQVEYEAILAYRGSHVFFRQGIDSAPVEGKLLGVGEAGTLRLEVDEGNGKAIKDFASGEIEAFPS